MSVSNNVVLGRSVGHSGTPVFARIVNPQTGALITQAALVSITYNFQDLTLGAQVATGAITIAATVYDTPVTADPSWVQDAVGYNFKYVIPAAQLKYTPAVDTQGNLLPHKFRLDVFFTPVSGEPFVLPCEFPAVPVLI